MTGNITLSHVQEIISHVNVGDCTLQTNGKGKMEKVKYGKRETHERGTKEKGKKENRGKVRNWEMGKCWEREKVKKRKG